MTHASLFSGIGGAELAARWMGWRNLFHCEINPFCRRVLNYHFPESTSYEDIKTTDFTVWRGRVDVLTGGFPCQPFSLAGRRKGAEDDRYLWPEMLRAIREIQPAWVVAENVTGILTMVQPGRETPLGGEAALFGEAHRDRTLLRREYVIETVCRSLEREGYAVQPVAVPACAVGAPHRRERVWIIAHSTDARAETHRDGREDGVLSVEASAHPNGAGLQAARPEQPSAGTARGGLERPSAHPNGELLESGDGEGQKGRQAPRIVAEPPRRPTDWEGFPTQSPVCSRDDGLSARLDGISFHRWREESVRAYGNAWVPQVAYEIFRAIAEEENR